MKDRVQVRQHMDEHVLQLGSTVPEIPTYVPSLVDALTGVCKVELHHLEHRDASELPQSSTDKTELDLRGTRHL